VSEQRSRRGPQEFEAGRGRRMVVQCLAPGCGHGRLMDPRPLFGAGRQWPPEGPSYRFRCVCGSRASQVRYTTNVSLSDGPISAQAISLWL
jgi:hypothetical protein